MGVILIIGILAINTVSAVYIRIQTERMEVVGELVQNLERNIGYRGLIHHFKNAVIRPDQPDYIDQAIEIGELISETAELGLPDGLGTLVETRAMIETYIANTYLVADGHSRGLSIAEIDQIVKVDDLPAEGELNSFRNAVHNVLNDRKILAEYVSLGLSVLTTGWIVFYIVYLGNRRNTLLLERLNLQNKNAELTRFAGIASLLNNHTKSAMVGKS